MNSKPSEHVEKAFHYPIVFRMADQLVYRGRLVGHRGWITQITTIASNPDILLSSSRGMFLKNVIFQISR